MTTLLIWNNKQYGWNSYPGHAAMSIDDNWSTPGQGRSYVSWWPDDGEKLKPGAGPNISVSQDLQAEGYAPDHIIQLYDTDVPAMLGKWKEIRNNPSANYRFVRNNCSTVVGQVLKRGHTGGSTMERNNLVWTPLKVCRLALSMGGQEQTWAEFLKELQLSGYLSSSDVTVLSRLYKRDARHGKNATQNSCYYSGGRKVTEKPFLVWQGFKTGSAKDGGEILMSQEGSLFSHGHITSTENNTVAWDE